MILRTAAEPKQINRSLNTHTHMQTCEMCTLRQRGTFIIICIVLLVRMDMHCRIALINMSKIKYITKKQSSLPKHARVSYEHLCHSQRAQFDRKIKHWQHRLDDTSRNATGRGSGFIYTLLYSNGFVCTAHLARGERRSPEAGDSEKIIVFCCALSHANIRTNTHDNCEMRALCFNYCVDQCVRFMEINCVWTPSWMWNYATDHIKCH